MYIIQEMQTTGDQTALVPAVMKANRNEAESAFLAACSYAAISEVPVHTVLWYDEHGETLDRKCYEHLS